MFVTCHLQKEFDMNKKILAGGAVAALAGVGVYKYLSGRQNNGLAADKWTVADIPDLSGKVIIVTGANSGIGYEAAMEFARHGAETILASRSIEKGMAALAAIQVMLPDAAVELMSLDLASLASVRAFAADFMARYGRLDVLVNNAGIMMVPYQLTEDGFESQFGTNHLGHFALTGLLSDLLLTTPGSRVVNISSIGHRNGEMDFDNLMYEGGVGYGSQAAYGRSKLANILFTNELQRRYEAAGVDAIAVAAHPGISNTNLAAHLYEERWYIKMAMPLATLLLQSAAMGALPTLRAAVDPAVKGGDYYGPDGFKEQRGYPVLVQSSDACYNLADAQRLWEVSEELTGVSFLD